MTFGIFLNNILTLGIWRSAITHLQGCFAPGPSFRISEYQHGTIGPFISHLATQLGYSAGEFQAL